MDWEPWWRVLLAAMLAVPIGLEREFRGKAAGLRTHVVVAIGAAALGHASVVGALTYGGDSTRIAAQVVSGIGFMGAGVIFASQGRVHGLTTAAALWSAAAVGLCVGVGAETVAGALVVVTVLFLAPVDWISVRLIKRVGHDEITVTLLADDATGIQRGQAALREAGASVRQVELSPFAGRIAARVQVRVRGGDVEAMNRRMIELGGVDYVSSTATGDEASGG